SLQDWLEHNLNYQHLSTLVGKSSEEVIKALLIWAKQYVSVSKLHANKSSPSFVVPSSLDSWVYLNTDGSVKSVDKFIVIGGQRNQNGKWIIKFNRYLGNCAVLDYELWGILDGLKIALDRSFQRVSIWTDSLKVFNLIYEDVRRDSNFALVRKIHMLLKCLSH
ncbi:hypothetical protein Gorai_023240, partial [Gossypium raimondii]|nr:hypothetical protein [Gossypium raimondii]